VHPEQGNFPPEQGIHPSEQGIRSSDWFHGNSLPAFGNAFRSMTREWRRVNPQATGVTPDGEIRIAASWNPASKKQAYRTIPVWQAHRRQLTSDSSNILLEIEVAAGTLLISGLWH
jgi:hypothetical protein